MGVRQTPSSLVAASLASPLAMKTAFASAIPTFQVSGSAEAVARNACLPRLLAHLACHNFDGMLEANAAVHPPSPTSIPLFRAWDGLPPLLATSFSSVRRSLNSMLRLGKESGVSECLGVAAGCRSIFSRPRPKNRHASYVDSDSEKRRSSLALARTRLGQPRHCVI